VSPDKIAAASGWGAHLPGSGQIALSKIRKVATAEGAAHYGLPIGSPIKAGPDAPKGPGSSTSPTSGKPSGAKGPEVVVTVKGKAIPQKFPAGSQVYVPAIFKSSPESAPTKYVKDPSGKWMAVSQLSTGAFDLYSIPSTSAQAFVNSVGKGSLVPDSSQESSVSPATPTTAPPKVEPKAPTAPAKDESQGHSEIAIKGDTAPIPPGSKIYVSKLAMPDKLTTKYFKTPDGQWKMAQLLDGPGQGITISDVSPQVGAELDVSAKDGKFIEEPAPQGDSKAQKPVMVTIDEQEVEFPPGSTVHVAPNGPGPDLASIKYVHTPTGEWHTVYVDLGDDGGGLLTDQLFGAEIKKVKDYPEEKDWVSSAPPKKAPQKKAESKAAPGDDEPVPDEPKAQDAPSAAAGEMAPVGVVTDDLLPSGAVVYHAKFFSSDAAKVKYVVTTGGDVFKIQRKLGSSKLSSTPLSGKEADNVKSLIKTGHAVPDVDQVEPQADWEKELLGEETPKPAPKTTPAAPKGPVGPVDVEFFGFSPKAQVYHAKSATPDTAKVKYVKAPDGSLLQVSKAEGASEQTGESIFGDQAGVIKGLIDSGNLVPESGASSKAPSQVSAPSSDDAPSNLKPVGSVSLDGLPAGTKVYHAKSVTPETATIKYVMAPTGVVPDVYEITKPEGGDKATKPLPPKVAEDVLVKIATGILVQDTEATPSQSKPQGQIKVKAGSKTWALPAGSTVYDTKTSSPTVYIKYAKLPDGTWVSVTPAGVQPLTPSQVPDLQVSIKAGWVYKSEDFEVVPESPSPAPSASAPKTTPAAPAKASQASLGTTKTTIGGVEVSAQEIADAISTLENAKGIMVKQPLAKVNSPLAKMDYHGVAAAEKTFHGSDWKSTTKPAVILYLKRQFKELAESDSLATQAQKEVAAKPTVTKPEADLIKTFQGGDFSKDGLVQIDGEGYEPGVYSSPGTKIKYHLNKDGTVYFVSSSGSKYDTTGGALAHLIKEKGYSKESTDSGSTQESQPEPKAPAAPSAAPSPIDVGGVSLLPGKYGKSTGKAYLQVNPDGSLIYVNSVGVPKSVGAKGFLGYYKTGLTEFVGPAGTTPSAADSSLPPVTPSGPKPGKYTMAVGDATDLVEKNLSTIQVFEDGSGVTVANDGSGGWIKTPLTSKAVLAAFESGTVFDSWGTSVVLPGQAPEKFYLFGAGPKTLDQLQQALDGVPAYGEKWIKYHLHSSSDKGINSDNTTVFADWGASQGVKGPGDLKSRLSALLSGMIHAAKVQAAPTTTELPGVQVNTSAPKASAVFTFDDKGYAIWLPKTGIPAVWTDKASLSKIISDLAKEFGDGKVVGKGRSKFTQIDALKWIQAWYKGDMAKVYAIEANTGVKTSPDHPGAPENSATHKIEWAPAVPGELPVGQIPASMVELVNSKTGALAKTGKSQLPMMWVNNYLAAANAQNAEYLTETQRRKWVRAHINGQKFTVDTISLHAQKLANTPGSASHGPVEFVANLALPEPHSHYVEAGTDPTSWPDPVITHYLDTHASTVAQGPLTWSQKASLVQWVLSSGDPEAWNPGVAGPSVLPASIKPVVPEGPEFTVTSIPILSSSYNTGIKVLKDKSGAEWVFKPKKPHHSKFRVEAEHEVHQVARLWGFQTADSRLLTFDGEFGQAQRKFPFTADLSGYSSDQFAKMTPAQLSDMAREHALDWAIGNDDPHGANFGIMPDGSVIGVDKGRGWWEWGAWPGLTTTTKMDSLVTTIYPTFYDAFKSGQVSPEATDEVYVSVIQRARRMASLPDEVYQSYVEKALANRSMSASARKNMITSILERKNALASDMEKVWAEVYQAQGRDKPEVPDQLLNPQGHTLHSGFTPELVESVKKTKSYGTAAFFSGTSVEDSHALVWREKVTNLPGSPYRIRGELKVRGPKLVELEGWLATRVGGDALMPDSGVDEDRQAIVQAAKSVSLHSVDGNYDPNHTAILNSLKKEFLATLDDPAANDDDRARATLYLSYIEAIFNAKNTGTKTQPGQFPKFVAPPKPPTPGAPGEPTVALVPASTSGNSSSNSFSLTLDENGELEVNGVITGGNAGKMYVVTLPTGETIQFRGNKTGTAITSQGLLRFSIPNEADAEVSLARIQGQLKTMGLDLNPATDVELELFYWRHLYNILRDRVDSKAGDGPYAGFNSAYANARDKAGKPLEKIGGMEEALQWREVFSTLSSKSKIEQFVAQGGHLPQFDHFDTRNPTQATGKPYWNRFDVTPEMWKSKSALIMSSSKESFGLLIAESGGVLSTEARIRALGVFIDGMSSTTDQDSGSSSYVFTRQNLASSSGGATVYLSPKVLARTSTYAFESDYYGKYSYKGSESSFAWNKHTKHSGSSNEAMVKDAISLLDGIEVVNFPTESARTKAIAILAARGITSIRGVPVSDRFVVFKNKSSYERGEYVAKIQQKSL
jgi:hypothetical protein